MEVFSFLVTESGSVWIGDGGRLGRRHNAGGERRHFEGGGGICEEAASRREVETAREQER